MSNTIEPLNRREFVRVAGASLAGGLLALTSPHAWSSATSGVPRTRLERLAKGANVCRWFRFVRQQSPEHFSNYITEAEAKLIHQIGLTHVRLCIQPAIIMDPQ